MLYNFQAVSLHCIAMSHKSAKILLTGLPGCGKTTSILNIIANLDCEKVAGFYTQEIRENHNRKGFRWKRLDGAAGILAHVNIKGRLGYKFDGVGDLVKTQHQSRFDLCSDQWHELLAI